MISIRFPAGSPIPAWVEENADVVVLDDTALVTLESEKNKPAHAESVDRVLRPMIGRMWAAGPRLFGIVSIETRSGCNSGCAFCPVAYSVDPRPAGELGWIELGKIADELSALGFAGRIALFGNNEPLLDHRIPAIVGLFRAACPDADIRLLSNGTKVRMELVERLFAAGLSTLTINNYSDGRRINPPVRSLLRSARELASRDIRVSVRNKDEVLTTRAGNAPNKPAPTGGARGFCALPFTDIYVTYTGDVALCCFDAYGQVVMGNIRDSPLVEIWRSTGFARYRDRLLRSDRSGLELCRKCDFDGFREPTVNKDHPLTRDAIMKRR